MANSPTVPGFASILAIGTELTTGQIINRNAAWLSQKLSDLGVEVVLHETVADDRVAIQDALERCSLRAPLLFVTGGLGPTTDDFTREVLAEWAGQSLQFQEASWVRINERLGRMGVPVAPSNRQQCFFPDRALVIPNPRGTADAFFLEHGETRVWTLPGPPAEIAAIWEQAKLADMIRSLIPEQEPVELLTWQCLGKSEAELGEITERALAGSHLKTGYRAHRPCIEIKVWCPKSRIQEARPYLARLEEAIAPWILSEGTELPRAFLRSLSRFEEIEILDAATGGVLIERLAPLLRLPEFADLSSRLVMATEWHPPFSAEPPPHEWLQRTLQSADSETLTLAVYGFSGSTETSGRWSLGLRTGEQIESTNFDLPYRAQPLPELIERAQRFATEKALQKWNQWLTHSIH